MAEDLGLEILHARGDVAVAARAVAGAEEGKQAEESGAGRGGEGCGLLSGSSGQAYASSSSAQARVLPKYAPESVKAMANPAASYLTRNTRAVNLAELRKR